MEQEFIDFFKEINFRSELGRPSVCLPKIIHVYKLYIRTYRLIIDSQVSLTLAFYYFYPNDYCCI